MDRAHVPDVFVTASRRAAHWRSGDSDGDPQALSKAQVAQTPANGKNREVLGAVPQRGMLVPVAEFGREDDVTNFRLPIFRFSGVFQIGNWQWGIGNSPVLLCALCG